MNDSFRIVESQFVKSAVQPSDYPQQALAEIAFVGKSNVGKSSLINTILARKAIAKTSSTPGKTQLINFFNIRYKLDESQDGYFSIVDLPGYGYAKVSKKQRDIWKVMIESYFDKRTELQGVILILDSRHSLDSKDQIMHQMLIAKQIPHLIVATKADKLNQKNLMRNLKSLSMDLNMSTSKIVPFSALNKTGVKEVIRWIQRQVFY